MVMQVKNEPCDGVTNVRLFLGLLACNFKSPPPQKKNNNTCNILDIQNESTKFWPKFSTALPALFLWTFHCVRVKSEVDNGQMDGGRECEGRDDAGNEDGGTEG
jgi:hypothetical protein